LLTNEPSCADCIFNFHDVRIAVSRLIALKNDGSTGLASDHIINAGNDCYTDMALLFTVIVVHGTVPGSFLYIIFVPIPKGKHGNVSQFEFSRYYSEFELW